MNAILMVTGQTASRILICACMIHSPHLTSHHITLKHPTIDFDVGKAFDIIHSSAREPVDYRGKPVCAVVRAMGRWEDTSACRDQQILQIQLH
jgi:hypothetical protein